MRESDSIPGRILLVDDDESFAQVIAFLLAEEGYEVVRAKNGQEALGQLQTQHFPIMVSDLKMPGMDGLELLKKAHAHFPNLLIIMITAFGDMATAVLAMKAGAFDFLPKPCDRDHFKLTIRRAMEHARLRRFVHELREPGSSAGKTMVFLSEKMTQLMATVDRVAGSEATLLIEGESGTGKELLARRIHMLSPRRSGPFIAVNCAAVPRDLLESELFGHKKGAYTGAISDRKGRFREAEGGTVLLDEIAEMPLDLQSRFLRVLQEKTLEPLGEDRSVSVNVRVLAATHRSLDAAVVAGQFRQDLFYRLNVVPLSLPPLRERTQDILPLARHFLAYHSGGREWQIPPESLKHLVAMSWPGNVRELENLCQRVALLAEEPILSEEFLMVPNGGKKARLSFPEVELPSDGISLVDLEKSILVRALEMNQYNQSSTARFLRIPRHVLLYRMEKYEIPSKGRG
jgi:two-component system NtrC family response regulator